MTEVLKTIRALLWVVGICAVAYILAPAFHKSAPVEVQQKQSVTDEVNAILKAADALAASHGSAPIYTAPAVSVIRDVIPEAKGLSDAQLALILSSLKPKTVEVAHAKTTVAAPTPFPLPSANTRFSTSDIQVLHDAAYSADVEALNKTTIKTDVTLTHEPAPLSRVATVITTNGSGISFDVVRRGQFNAFVAGIERKSHVLPTVGASYCIHGTTLCAGPVFTTEKVGASLSVHF